MSHLKLLAICHLVAFLLSVSVQANRHNSNGTEADVFSPRDPLIMEVLGISESGNYRRLRQELRRCSEPKAHNICQVVAESQESNSLLPAGARFWRPDTQVIFLGERHINLEHQFALADLLSRFAADGFEVLALEMFNQRDQASLDLYLEGALTLDELIQILRQNWTYDSSGYRQILATAKGLGLRLVALDDRNDEAARQDFWNDLIRRDQVMASNLLPHLSDKTIVYTGALHSVKTFSQTGGLDALTITENLLMVNPHWHIENYLFSSRSGSGYGPLIAEVLEVEREGVRIPHLSDYLDGFIYPQPEPETLMVAGSSL